MMPHGLHFSEAAGDNADMRRHLYTSAKKAIVFHLERHLEDGKDTSRTGKTGPSLMLVGCRRRVPTNTSI